MRGQGKFSVIAQNITATAGQIRNEKRMIGHKNLCWKCQKDKHLKGGKLKFFGAGCFRVFICADCVAAKAEAKKEPRPA